MMPPKTDLYNQDFYAWVQKQAALLKARQFDVLDLDNLIEEVESIARQERHLLWHRFRTLLTHLVAWWGEIPERCIRWEGVITEQRQQIQDILTDSPSLAPLALEELADAWESVRQRSADQWHNAAFPVACPWTLDQALDEEFWPTEDTFRTKRKEEQDATVSPLDVDRRGVA